MGTAARDTVTSPTISLELSLTIDFIVRVIHVRVTRDLLLRRYIWPSLGRVGEAAEKHEKEQLDPFNRSPITSHRYYQYYYYHTYFL